MQQVANFGTPTARDHGADMIKLIEELYPICRSLTGDGVRYTFDLLKNHVPVTTYEVPSGTHVFDWEVPKEWNIKGGWIKGPKGEKIVDFADSNLHVLNYSVPVHKKVGLEELKSHLFSLPEHPDWIPYRTSYYNENWGFCLSHRQLESLEEGEYEVFIDSTLAPGSLTYGEVYLPGETEEEILLSTHICHPSLCNDNLSGIAVMVELIKALQELPHRRHSFRFIFIPTTIGSITWLARNEANTHKIKHGLVATLLGDGHPFTYQKTRNGKLEIDKVATHALINSGQPFEIQQFNPFGFDERQFSTPGFQLPVARLTRSTLYTYREYHSSADNIDAISPTYLKESLDMYLKICLILDRNCKYMNLVPKGEVRLGKRGLYHKIGGNSQHMSDQMAMLWILNYADGTHDLVDIANDSGIPFDKIYEIALILKDKDLLAEA
ncbi:MAG: DUF4910 domain-containing protein [Bacteroidota bacterium]